jgi:hypothetical protein
MPDGRGLHRPSRLCCGQTIGNIHRAPRPRPATRLSRDEEANGVKPRLCAEKPALRARQGPQKRNVIKYIPAPRNGAAEHANTIRRKDLSITTHPAYTTAAGPMWPVSGVAARGPIALRLLAYNKYNSRLVALHLNCLLRCGIFPASAAKQSQHFLLMPMTNSR